MPKIRYDHYIDREPIDIHKPKKESSVKLIMQEGNYTIKKDNRLYFLYRNNELIGYYNYHTDAVDALHRYQREDAKKGAC